MASAKFLFSKCAGAGGFTPLALSLDCCGECATRKEKQMWGSAAKHLRHQTCHCRLSWRRLGERRLLFQNRVWPYGRAEPTQCRPLGVHLTCHRTPCRQQGRPLCTAADQHTSSVEPGSPIGPLEVTKLDLRVGKVLSVEAHPEADSLYVETVDVGEDSPRTIISGLVKYVQANELQGRTVVAVCNLKPRKMKGISSDGMLLCASNLEHTQVELLCPPEGAEPGQRIHFGEQDGGEQPEPATPNQVAKKKVFETVQPDLKTTDEGVAVWKGLPMLTPQGPVTAPSLTNARIS